MIKVGSLRKNAKHENGLHVRCDRATSLGNSYPLSLGRAECIKAYADNWHNLMQNPKAIAYFNFIKEQSKKRDVVLMCWCAPSACHCDVIKAKLEE